MSRSRVRPPILAGTWYSGTKDSLQREIGSLFMGSLGPGSTPKLNKSRDPRLVALMSPHAGYLYSGQAAAWAFFEAARHGPRDTIIVISPNHRGLGSPMSASVVERWRTPLGETEIDMDLTKEIVKKAGFVDLDDASHSMEHSIEIQLPLLQYVYGSFRMVAITSYALDLDASIDLGKAIAEASKGKNVLVVASSDMTHYQPHKDVIEKDEETLSAIVSLDEKVVSGLAIRLESLCGHDAVVATIVAAKKLGANNAKVLCHYTSGDVTGDKDSVVGYASVGFYS